MTAANATAKSKAEDAKARFKALLNSRTVSQLSDMFALIRNANGSDHAAVRGAIYVRLCELVGDDRADEICE